MGQSEESAPIGRYNDHTAAEARYQVPSTRIYESVTRVIIEEMKRGAVPWVRPWKTDRHNAGSVMPGSAITGRSYSGVAQ